MSNLSWLSDPTGLFLLGVILLMIGLGVVELGLSRKAKQFLKLGGVALAAYAALTMMGVSLVSESEAPPASVTGDFDVTATESMSHLNVDNTGHVITWAVTYSYSSQTFSSGTQYAQITFSIDRGVGTVGLAQTSGNVVSVASVANSTTGLDYPLLTKTGDQYSAIWSRADGSLGYERISLTIPEDSDGVVAGLNMTLSPTAIHSMDQYETKIISIEIGGETWSVQVLLASVT